MTKLIFLEAVIYQGLYVSLPNNVYSLWLNLYNMSKSVRYQETMFTESFNFKMYTTFLRPWLSMHSVIKYKAFISNNNPLKFHEQIPMKRSKDGSTLQPHKLFQSIWSFCFSFSTAGFGVLLLLVLVLSGNRLAVVSSPISLIMWLWSLCKELFKFRLYEAEKTNNFKCAGLRNTVVLILDSAQQRSANST